MNTNKSYLFSIYVIGALFFIFGFVTWINSVLIPFLKQVCQLTNFEALLVTFSFYISYFVMALPSSWVLKKTGFVKGMSLGLIVMAIGSVIFIPAALDRNYILFLLGLFIQGTGLALLQTASNPYVTILGPIESAAQRICIMGICNKVAGMIGIFLLSYLLFSDINSISEHLATTTGEEHALLLSELSHKIIIPYIAITVLLLLLGFAIQKAHLPEIDAESNVSEGEVSRKSIFSYPYLWLGVLTLFFYTGAEVVAVDTLGLYGKYCGLTDDVATKLGTYSLLALTVGYILGILLIPKYISQRKALAVCAGLNIVFLALALLTTGKLSIFFIVMLSFGNALMWPSIWPLSIEGLGKYTGTASALMIMAIAGGATIPLLYGAWADAIGGNLHLPYLILLPSYIIILLFATRLYKIGRGHENA
ncbi:sugar MFS transporter [Gallalistipes aquisgranensis]|uniref:sugar MFS transporter n=1 Tax=Gallalistipes aquisgranensis TaxID=2779358 RepID=UPI001CF804DE|nr:sugar MFS transporter [Gallalistipes aquisgranensis]MBE5032555.1 sugar MFS transporter [Gallalistipes aquisgranensis]